MNANGGLGKVTDKNILLYGGQESTDRLDWPTATRHANGRDWWVIVPKDTGNLFQIYLADPNGITLKGSQYLPPWVSITGHIDWGQNVFSPDGSRFVDLDMQMANIRVFDFDRCLGSLSNLTYVAYFDGTFLNLPNLDNDWTFMSGGGAAISPNSRFLYTGTQRTIYQYDLEATDIKASVEIVAEYDGHQAPYGSYFYLTQLGPDGRIYINSNNGETVMHVINRPNEKGLACDVRQHGLQLPRYNYRSMPHFPNYRLGPLDGSPCDTLGTNNLPLANFRCEVADSTQPLVIDFIDNSSYAPTAWAWDFGDSTTSTEQDPVHEFPGNGVYHVCLTVSNDYGSDTYCKYVVIGGTSGTGERQLEAGFSLVPNPSGGHFDIVFAEGHPNAGLETATLTDAAGRVALEQRLAWNGGVARVDASHLPEGTYVLKLQGHGAGGLPARKLLILR